jgi:hypothetical protein
MILQTILLIIEWLRNILLGIALFFGIQTIKKLFQTDSKNGIIGMKRIVFTLITIAFAFLMLGFIIENMQGVTSISRHSTTLSIIFFSISYLLLIFAFAYFWYDSSRFHLLHVSEPVFFAGVTAGVLIWIYYLFRSTFLAHPVLASNQGIIFFLHPLAVALIFLLTLIIHPAHKAKVIRTPLWYISSGIFMYFLGYMIMAYSFIKPVAKLIPLLYTILLFLSSAYFALGLFAASRKFGSSKPEIIKEKT